MTEEQRHNAIQRIRAKRGFWGHLAIYIAVNALLVGIWAITSPAAFWPIWPMLGWGIGVVAHAASVYIGPRGISEKQIDREMQRQFGS